MGDTLRIAVGILGNAASLLLYAAPILTFKRVIKKKNTEDFSSIPYIIALLNCLLYTWYGLPVVSSGWENFPVATINGSGILLEFSFIFIYIWFSSVERKKLVSLMVIPVMALFCITVFISSFAVHDRHHRKAVVGSIGLVASIAMYSSPLVAVKLVIKTKSVEFMPFYLSFFSFTASSLWLAYGFLGRDLFIAAPNILGCPMGLLQLILYCTYRSSKGVAEEPNKMDLEKSVAKFGLQRQLANRESEEDLAKV